MVLSFYMADPQVLVVGAGPTGLVLALWLARRGIAVRIIDKVAEPGTTSRALVVHARTLEFYRQLGIADDLISRAVPFDAVNLWVYGRRVARADVGAIGTGFTPFPHLFIFPQDEHERLLIDHLQRAGVDVDRPAELLGFEDHGDAVVARIRGSDGSIESCRSGFLAGCDGARSVVREALGVGFPGGTYERMFYVADVELRGPIANHELHVALDEADLLAAFPLAAAGGVRLIGTVRPDAVARADQLSWDDVSRRAADRLEISAQRVNWFSTYHVHHRVANQFRAGRVFLVGDAAHIHSPVGGQGMNTGIGDAVNLAWKLAEVLRHPAAENILDTYQPERIAFARRLVATTDRGFTFITRDGMLARFVRRRLFPALLPGVMAITAFKRFLFRTLSQTRIKYRGSALSRGRTGSIHGGDRLPWVAPANGEAIDNFTSLESMDWQLHVYGAAPAKLVRACTDRSLPLHVFPWRDATRASGLARNAGYLIRPDGYVAVAGVDAESLGEYFDNQRISIHARA
jgi:2-polyprenyl-6-methoxyphenol hydroxylase-like FAD-dependent oxidoreductase